MILFTKRVKRFFLRKCKAAFDLIVNKPIGVIYMLHRVADIDNNKFLCNEELKVSPRFLEEFILSIKDQYEFISIDELSSYKIRTNKHKKPFVIFTIDDGYKDNFTYAYPIFEKYNVPFTVYLATDLIDSPKPYLWWYYLEDIIANNDFVELSTGDFFECSKYDDKLRVFKELRNWVLDFPNNNSEILFRSVFEKYHEELSVDYSKLMLKWTEIIEMSKNPICTIGAHTKSHCRLSL